MQTIDIAQVIDRLKIGGFHIRLLVFSFLIMMTDGFDLGAAAFAGPALIKEWGIKGPELRVLFSAALVAGLAGPPLLGWLSDHFGRRRVVIGGALFFGAFTLLSVLTHSLNELIVVRVIAGIGLAGVLPIVVALNNEFAPRRVRATMVIIMFTGVTFGGGLPGLVAAKFMGEYGWRILFWIGGLAPIAVAILLIFVLPESIKFLSLRPQRRPELARLLGTLQPGLVIPQEAQIVIGGEENRGRFSMKALFEGGLAFLTPLFWIANAINLGSFYFLNQWIPTILSTAGVPVEHAAIATTLFQFGGTLGGLLSMRLLDRYGFIPVPVLFACAIPVVASIGLPGLPELAVVALIAASGFCLLGLQFGMIALEATIYPTYIRAWGLGSCFAAGRVGSGIGPYMGGVLLAMHLPLQDIFLYASGPLVIGLAAAVAITPLYRRQFVLANAPAASASD